MGVAAVVLTKNSEAAIRECLDSVSQNNPEEIIVVDGSSTDRTLDIVAEYTDKVYNDEGKGITYARQLGAERANEEYILYVDSDVVLEPDTLEVMLTEVKSKRYGALAARALRDGATKSLDPGEVKATVPMFCTIFPRELILGYGFDSTMPDCDDFEICYKLLKHGHKIALSSAYATHRTKDRKTAIQHLYRVGKAQAEFCIKYWRSPRILTKYVILRGLGAPLYEMVSTTIRGKPHLVPMTLMALIVQAVGFLLWLVNIIWNTVAKAVFVKGIEKSQDS